MLQQLLPNDTYHQPSSLPLCAELAGTTGETASLSLRRMQLRPRPRSWMSESTSSPTTRRDMVQAAGAAFAAASAAAGTAAVVPTTACAGAVTEDGETCAWVVRLLCEGVRSLPYSSTTLIYWGADACPPSVKSPHTIETQGTCAAFSLFARRRSNWGCSSCTTIRTLLTAFCSSSWPVLKSMMQCLIHGNCFVSSPFLCHPFPLSISLLVSCTE